MEKDTYVFVRNVTEFNTAKKLIKSNKINLGTSLFILWDNSSAYYFDDIKAEYVFLENYAKNIDFNNARKKMMELVKTFPHIKLLNNKTFTELLEYDGYSLWWFIRQGFYGHCIRVMKEVLTIKALIKNKKIGKIMMLNEDKEFISIVREAIKDLKITIELSNNNPTIKKSYIKNKKETFLNYFPRFIRIIQGFLRSFKINDKKGKKNILLFTQAHVWTNLTENIRGDANSYTILRELVKRKDYNVIPIDIAINKNAAWKGIREKKIPFLPFDYFIFGSFFDFGIRKKLNILRKRLRKLLDSLDKLGAFKKTLIYNNVNLYDILRPQIKNYFLNEFDSFIGATRNFEIGKKILKDYRINAAICLDENGTSRFFVFAADSCNIPSLGLQHGIIYPLHISYNYSKEDLNSYKPNLNCLLPDKTAVFGGYFKDLLVKIGDYNENKIVVTGQPRTDILFEQRKYYSKKDLYKKLGIDFNKKLVVFASQPLKDLSESRVALSAIVSCLRNIDNVNLVVKLHPNDDMDFYKKILKDLNYDAIIIKETDLYRLLFSSDIVLSISSTVMLEALIMDKPVIQVNLIEDYDFFGHLRGKVFFHAKTENELRNAIVKCLFDKSALSSMKKNRENFISDYYYAIDGKSTKRLLGILEDITENDRR